MRTATVYRGRPAQGESLASRYERIRCATIALTAPLTPEDQVVQVLPETSPTKWHLAHTTWFFERFCLMEYASGYRPFEPLYDRLFNSYYYTVGEMHPRAERGLLSRPTVGEIRAYREHVDLAMRQLLDERAGDAALEALVELGLNHEQQHQELLLTDIKQAFFANPLGPAYEALQTPPTSQTALRFVERAGGVYSIGTNVGEAGFCFDNETPRHRVLVRPHALGSRLVTNGEYREFVEAGGYRTPQIWLADAWIKLQQPKAWSRPLCWSDDLAREFTLAGWRELDPNAPVCHVSYYEADAFAHWAGARLPSEAEWELAAHDAPLQGNLLERGYLQPVAAGSSARQPIEQLYGDVWEWCATSYEPYPGFKPLPGSLGEYNGKFMCNQIVVRGGSCATAAEHIRATYRSFFYPHDRWQFLGFRLAKDL